MKIHGYLLLFTAILTLVLPASAQYQTGDTVADFTLSDINGDAFNLYDHQGKVIFINFFALT